MPPDAARRPGFDPSAVQSSSLARSDEPTVHRQAVAVDPRRQVETEPLPGRPLTVDDRRRLVGAWGEHVVALLDSGALQARRDDETWYLRPGAWRSLTPDERTYRVIDMLTGAVT